jgi:CHAT domain-containing protein
VVTDHGTWGYADLASVTTIHQLVGDLQFQIGRALAHGRTPPTAGRLGRLQRDVDLVLEALYDTVLAPLEHHLTGMERLIVAPSGDLHGVPFAALRHGDDYLLHSRSLIVAPSFSVLATMPGLATALVTRHPVVVGVPDALAPDLATEAELVANRLPQATPLVSAEATKAAVMSALPSASLVHLATHGRFDAAHPGSSGLRLMDGWLTLDDLSRVALERSLLVLTGCETGRVQVQEGDDLEGLMAALIAAGAAGLVASLWKTHDTAATALIGLFYDNLADGADPATALRRAQQTVRETFPHPAFWAPFVAVHSDQKGA